MSAAETQRSIEVGFLAMTSSDTQNFGARKLPSSTTRAICNSISSPGTDRAWFRGHCDILAMSLPLSTKTARHSFNFDMISSTYGLGTFLHPQVLAASVRPTSGHLQCFISPRPPLDNNVGHIHFSQRTDLKCIRDIGKPGCLIGAKHVCSAKGCYNGRGSI